MHTFKVTCYKLTHILTLYRAKGFWAGMAAFKNKNYTKNKGKLEKNYVLLLNEGYFVYFKVTKQVYNGCALRSFCRVCIYFKT